MAESASRYAAARRLMRDLDEEAALRKNPLLAPHADERHDRLRARVLRAVESLDPGLAATSSSERQYRLYQILARCDINGQSHKEVAAALGISRRQFYLDRRAAFLRVADAIEATCHQPFIEGPSPDVLSLHIEYVQMLCEQGRYDAVWRESLRALGEMRGHARELEVWNIAAEASRFLGNFSQSHEALDQMSSIAATYLPQELRRASALRIAIAEIALDWMQGNIDGALLRFDNTVEDSGNERTMYGRDATLFAILLGYGAELCIERGGWQRAETLVRRAERIIDRSEVPYAKARQQRLRARIAYERNGDSSRSALEFRDALRLVQQHKQLPAMAKGAVEYGIALADIDRREAMKYIDSGLIMAKDVCGTDRSAVLLASAAALIMERSGPDVVLSEITELKAARLTTHADLMIGVAEADARLARGDFEVAAESGATVGHALEDAALFPAAAKAKLILVEGLARSGRTATAQQLFKKSNDFLRAYADHATRRRADRFALLLHSLAK